MTVTTQVTRGVPSTSNDAVLEVLKYIPNEQIDLVYIGQAATPFLTTVMTGGREMNKSLDQTERFDSLGVSEEMWSGGHTVVHFEQDELIRTFTVNGALNSSATTVVLDSTLGLKKYDILKVTSGTTNEMLHVVSVDSATQITVTRAFGTATAANIADNATLLRFSSSVAAGVPGVTDVKVLSEQRTNFVQKFVETLSGNDYDDLKKAYDGAKGNAKAAARAYLDMKLSTHKKDLEYAALIGQKKDDYSGSKSYQMEGIIELAKRGNQADYSAGFTKADFAEAVSATNKYGRADKKYAFCGAAAMAEIADLFDVRQYKTDGLKDYSVELSTFTLPNGTSIKLLQHPLFEDLGLSGYMLIVDISAITIVWAQGQGILAPEITKGQTRILPRPDNNYASYNTDIVTFMSMKNKNARAHGLFRIV